MTTIENKYRFNEPTFSGNFSTVFIGVRIEDNLPVAIKKILTCNQNAKREVDIMRSIDHQNIVKCHDFIHHDNHWYIIMEYCELGTLEEIIRLQVGEETSRYFANQLKNAMEYLRLIGYMHRDLKPANILLTAPDCQLPLQQILIECKEKIILKLTDFGVSKLSGDDLTKTYCGSPLYMAPEIVLEQPYNSTADIWSIGIIIYQLLQGEHPYMTKNYPKLVARMKERKNIKISSEWSPECQDLIKSMLKYSCKKRLSWDKFFNHPWFDHPSMASSPISIKSNDDIRIPFASMSVSPLGPSNLSRMKKGSLEKLFNWKSHSAPKNTKLSDFTLL
jgi:serine/threonine-protein kinase ULK2